MNKEKQVSKIDKEIEELTVKLNTTKGREIEVYTRIVGYYRSVKNFNPGKKAEYKTRYDFPVNEKELLAT